jgi:hypothetical protein
VQPSIADAASADIPRLRSFLTGGFEGADHRNSAGIPVATLDITGHDPLLHVVAPPHGIGFRGSPPACGDWLPDGTNARFDRVLLQGNIAPFGKRPGHFALACEIEHAASRPLALHGSMLVGRCIDACVLAGWISSRDDVVVTHETATGRPCEPRVSI